MSVAPSGALPTACDFGADASRGQVTLHSTGRAKTIEIRMGKAQSAQVSFTANSKGAEAVVARDIDRDGDVDLIWVGGDDPSNAVVLLNDGDGRFAEVTDNSQYASEFEGLFGNDPSGDRKLKRGRKSSSLTSASFQPASLFLTQFQSTKIVLAAVSNHETSRGQSPFVRYLRKRGPPTPLS